MKTNRLSPFMVAILASFTAGAFAQAPGPLKPNYEVPTDEIDNQDIPTGVTLSNGAVLYPFVGAKYGRDDNVLVTPNNKKSSNVYALAAGLKLKARSGTSAFGLDFDTRSTRYQQSRADDYDDTRLGATGEFEFSNRMGLRLGAEYNKGHDPRGTTDRGTSGQPDEFRNSGFGGLFALGGRDAGGRIELEAGSYSKRYTNNRNITFASDFDTNKFAGRFFARLAPKTSFVFEAREDRLDYKSSISLFDSKERFYMAGITWDATAATSGIIKVGQIRKDFVSGSKADFSGSGWDATVIWSPLTYSRFTFTTAKLFSEATGVGDYILSKRYGAGWQHEWNSRFSTAAYINRYNDDFANNGRSDSTDSIGFKLNYKVRRWLTIGGDFSNVDRDSNAPGSRYKKNVYMFTADAAL